MPKVSICIPAYQNAAGIARLLDSVKKQNFTDYEVILTDDSPDDSVQEAAHNSGIDSLRYQKNVQRLGATANWNAAVHQAGGEYIKIMHHDDWFADENALAAFVAMLDENPGADLAFCGSWQVTLSSEGKESDHRFARHISPKHCSLIQKDWRNLFLGGYIGAPSATIYRNKGVDYEEKLKWLVDVEFYMRLLERNPVFAYTCAPLVCIGISGGQLTESCRENGELNIFEYGFVYNEFRLQDRKEYREKFIHVALDHRMTYKYLKPYGIPGKEYYRILLDRSGKYLVFLAGVVKRKLSGEQKA